MSTTIETLKNSNVGMLALAAFAFLMTAVLVFFIIRMLVGGRLRMPGGRIRQARLGIVDAFDLDRQRQLILVRRDNTEHLIMIGGPNDLLIESEIVRVEARDLRRDKAPEFMAGSSDGRIPAPFAQPAERAEADAAPVDPAQILPELTSPLPLPVSNSRPDDLPFNGGAPVEPVAARTPTFPLPPRRPPPPERRVPPRPPEPARPAARIDPPLVEGGLPPRPIVDVPAEPRMDAPVAIDVAPPVVAPSFSPPPISSPPVATPTPPPLVAPAPATPRAMPPSFLKPLPPRPPIRPLVRSNPRLPGAGTEPASPIASPPPSVSPPPAPVLVVPPMAETPPAAPIVESRDAPPKEASFKDIGHAGVAPKDSPPKDSPPKDSPPKDSPPKDSPPTDSPPKDSPPKDSPPKDSPPKDSEPTDASSKDALESLEEEMAKLLGRGPGG